MQCIYKFILMSQIRIMHSYMHTYVAYNSTYLNVAMSLDQVLNMVEDKMKFLTILKIYWLDQWAWTDSLTHSFTSYTVSMSF